MGSRALPSRLTDLFGGTIELNPRDDGLLLARYTSPHGWQEQQAVPLEVIEPWLTETRRNDAAAFACALHALQGRLDKPGWTPFAPKPYPPAELWSLGMTPRGPDFRKDYKTALERLQWALLLHSPGYVAYVQERGGVVRGGPADLLYYTKDWNAIVPAVQAKLVSNAKSEAGRKQALITFGAFVFGKALAGIVGYLTTDDTSYDLEPPPTVEEVPTVEDDILNGIDEAFSDGLNTDLFGEISAGIGGASADAGSVLGSLEADSFGSIGGLLSGAGSILKTVTSSILNGITNIAGEGGGVLVNVLQLLASGLHDVVGAVQSTLLPILQPIKDAVSITAGAVRDLNDNLIRPVFGSLVELQRQYKAIQESIDRNLGDGIEGIVRLGNDLSMGLTSMESTVTRGLDQLTRAQEATVRGALADVLGASLGAPLAGINAGMQTRSGVGALTREPAELIHLDANLDVEQIAVRLGQAVEEMRKAEGLLSPLLHLVGWLLDAGPAVLGYLKATYDRAYLAGKSIDRGERLGVADAITAAQRRIIDRESLGLELSLAGFNEPRQRALMELAERLVPINEAIALWRRGIVTESVRNDLLQRAGVPAEQMPRLVLLSDAIKGLPTVVREYSMMTAAEATGVLGQSELVAPEAVLAQGYEAGESTGSIHAAWRLQWSMPSAASATQLYFRGLITLDQLFAFYDVADIPKGLHWAILEGQRTPIPARTAISMHKAGVIDAGRMKEIVLAAGYSPPDAELLIKYAEIEDKAPPKEAADALHGLTQSAVLNLYEAGTIDVDTSVSLLVQIGIGEDAAVLAVSLIDLRLQEEERRAITDLIVARVDNGELSVDEAQGALSSAGLTTLEMEKAYTRILRGARAKSKIPSVGDLGRMWKRNVIGDDLYTATVMRHGYSREWADLMLSALQGGDIPEGG